jgi:hypothetical protein
LHPPVPHLLPLRGKASHFLLQAFDGFGVGRFAPSIDYLWKRKQMPLVIESAQVDCPPRRQDCQPFAKGTAALPFAQVGKQPQEDRLAGVVPILTPGGPQNSLDDSTNQWGKLER